MRVRFQLALPWIELQKIDESAFLFPDYSAKLDAVILVDNYVLNVKSPGRNRQVEQSRSIADKNHQVLLRIRVCS